MPMLKTRKIILALIHQLPKMMNEQTNKQMFNEVKGLYRKLELYNIVMINHMREGGI